MGMSAGSAGLGLGVLQTQQAAQQADHAFAQPDVVLDLALADNRLIDATQALAAGDIRKIQAYV
jgi:hypothetical protein